MPGFGFAQPSRACELSYLRVERSLNPACKPFGTAVTGLIAFQFLRSIRSTAKIGRLAEAHGAFEKQPLISDGERLNGDSLTERFDRGRVVAQGSMA